MEPHALSNLVIVPWTLAQLLALFLLSTVVFDVIHVLLHHFVASRFAWLRALGMLHERHHRFVDANLDVHEEYTADNLRWHVIPEFLTQVVFSLCLLWLLCAPVVLGVMALQTLVFLLILRTRGRDLNHLGRDAMGLPALHQAGRLAEFEWRFVPGDRTPHTSHQPHRNHFHRVIGVGAMPVEPFVFGGKARTELLD